MTLGQRVRPSTSVKDWVNPQPVPAYVRPADWLALPVVTSSDQKFVGLHAVYDHESNFVAVNCAGAYTVDWGDGTAPENIATGVQANHNYVYSALGSGTLSTRGYRQALVTITPQAGQNLTTVNLLVKHNQSGLVAGTTSGWLDVRMAGSLITTLTIGGVTTNVAHRLLEQFDFVGTCAITTCSGKFQNCSALQSVVAFHPGTSTVFTSMFQSCTSLQTVPLINTAAGVTFTSMFQSCTALRTIPLLNTASGTTFTNMFNLCSALQAIPLLNTAAGVTFTSMFNTCSALQQIPLFNTASGTNFSSMFNACSALQTVPLLNTAAGTSFTSMFQSCTALQTIPLINTAAGTNFATMFNGCSALQTIPLINTAAGLTFDSMFNTCSALETVPALNTAAGTSFTTMFSGCPSLRSAPLAGTSKTISYASCSLGPAALDAIYTALASGVTAQTITVTSNWGVASDTPATATGKGWSVVGS